MDLNDVILYLRAKSGGVLGGTDTLESFAAHVNGKLDQLTMSVLDKDLMLQFLDELIAIATHALGPRRQRALAALRQWVDDEPLCVFLMVDQVEFAFQLVIRMLKPDTMDQSTSDFCGQAGLLYNFAVANPDDFVAFGMGLLERGRGRLGNAVVRPSQQIRDGMVPFGMKCVDYVLLSSIRNSLEDITGDQWLTTALQSTDPRLLCGWLQKVGYQDVCNEISHKGEMRHFEHIDAIETSITIQRFAVDGVTRKPQTRTAFEAEDMFRHRKQLDLLKKAQMKLMIGHKVILAIDPSLLRALRGRVVRPSLTEDQYLHYAVVTRLQITPLGIGATIHSYGKITDGMISSTIFLQRFYGFISARP